MFPSARLACRWMTGALALCTLTVSARGAEIPSIDPASLEPHNLKMEAVDYLGRKAVRLTTVADGSRDRRDRAAACAQEDGTRENGRAPKVSSKRGKGSQHGVSYRFRVHDR